MQEMKTLFVLPLLLIIQTFVLAQTSITGTIFSKEGDPVPGANIILENTYDGTSSDAKGSFSFTTSESGNHTLIVRFVGYREHRESIVLQGSSLKLAIVIVEEINELEAVTISAGAFTAGESSRRTVFRPLDIATTAGATADIAGALNTLPGTQKVGESGRLFVRGGDGTETRTFIDGMVVLDAYGPTAPNTPSRGRFLPFMFKGTSFSTGGYSAEFGQALSSALVLDSRDESEMTKTDIGLLSVGADVAHTQAWKSGSAAAKIQYTNIRPYFGLINQEIDWVKAPASLEGVFAFRQKTGKHGMFKLYGNFNQSDFSLYNHDIDDYSVKSLFELTNRYRYINAYYRTILNENWALRGGISYTAMGNEFHFDQQPVNEKENGVHAKVVAEGSLSKAIEIKTGVEVIGRDYSIGSRTVPGSPVRAFDETVSALFTEADIYTSNNFVTRAGARLEYNSLSGETALDPRLSVAYKVHKDGQVSLAYGNFRQSVRNEYLIRNTTLDNEKAQHFILNYQRISNNRTLRIETFYKNYDNLVKFNDMAIGNQGNGFAKGVEFFWRDNRSFRGIDYWVSYSYLDTKRDYLDFPVEATPVFASKHNVSLVGKYFVQSLKSQLGATWSYTSGRPYNNPNQERFHASKTPAYQDLSFNWSYLPKPYLIFHFSCTNLLGHDNIFGYEYSTKPNPEGMYNGRAIRQPAPRFLFIGIFLTLSKDKTMNQLPTL